MEKQKGGFVAQAAAVFTEQEELAAQEFAEYLALIKMVYTLSYQNMETFADLEEILESGIDAERLQALRDRVEETFGDLLADQALTAEDRQRLYEENLEEENLKVISLKRESPLELVMAGAAIPLICALILSGGKLDVKVGPAHVKIELPSIIPAIRDLRDLFARPGRPGKKDQADERGEAEPPESAM